MRETAHRNPHRKSGPPVVRLQGMNNCRAEPAVATIAVRSLTSTRVKTSKNQWRARVAVELRDVKAGAAIANVTVSGSFSPGGSASCVTATTGSCTVEGGNISDGTTATVYTIGAASATSLAYDSTINRGDIRIRIGIGTASARHGANLSRRAEPSSGARQSGHRS